MKKLLLLISLLLATNAWAEMDKAEAIATTMIEKNVSMFINIIIITAVNIGD
tara:strand:+ start:33 stop:188 length:156 start_codon:yes stop_codon:yes gene_type:complete